MNVVLFYLIYKESNQGKKKGCLKAAFLIRTILLIHSSKTDYSKDRDQTYH
jgi:hypothetical protein